MVLELSPITRALLSVLSAAAVFAVLRNCTQLVEISCLPKYGRRCHAACRHYSGERLLYFGSVYCTWITHLFTGAVEAQVVDYIFYTCFPGTFCFASVLRHHRREIVRDSRKSRKHGSRVFRVFRQLPCFPCFFAIAVFCRVFCNFVGLLTVLHSFGALVSTHWSMHLSVRISRTII